MNSHGLVVAVMDHSPLLALLALLLELEVLLKDGGEAVPLQHARLVDHLVLVGWQSVQVVEEGDIVSWQGVAGSEAVKAFRGALTADGCYRGAEVRSVSASRDYRTKNGSKEQLPHSAAPRPSLSLWYVLNICSRLLQSRVKSPNDAP